MGALSLPPTDPDVQVSRIRLFNVRIRTAPAVDTATAPEISLSDEVPLRLDSRDPKFPPSFPPSVPHAGLPFPPQGPVGFGSPASPVLREAPTSCRSSRRARFPRPSVPVAPSPPETAGSPRFLGIPLCTRRVLRPRRDLGASRWRRSGADSTPVEGTVSHEEFVSRLHLAAHALPVYASQPGLPPHHATLGSRPVASLCRAGLGPAGTH
jgi:hypothetical protein